MTQTRLIRALLRVNAQKVFLFTALLFGFVLVYTLSRMGGDTAVAPSMTVPDPAPVATPASPWRQLPTLKTGDNPFTSPRLTEWIEQTAARAASSAPAAPEPEPEPPAAPPPAPEPQRVQLHYHGKLTQLDGSVRAFVSAPAHGWQRTVRVGQTVKEFTVLAIDATHLEIGVGEETYRLPRGETVTLEAP